jgi:peptidoglycan/LPS O-acetylase OafA/YrhL
MYFWVSIGSILLLVALENFEPLQWPFRTRFVQYLGDISFSLYILHFPMMLTIGRKITVGLIEVSGSKPLGFCLGGLILTPVLFWISDVHWRLFDESSIRFAKSLANWASFEKSM